MNDKTEQFANSLQHWFDFRPDALLEVPEGLTFKQLVYREMLIRARGNVYIFVKDLYPEEWTPLKNHIIRALERGVMVSIVEDGRHVVSEETLRLQKELEEHGACNISFSCLSRGYDEFALLDIDKPLIVDIPGKARAFYLQVPAAPTAGVVGTSLSEEHQQGVIQKLLEQKVAADSGLYSYSSDYLDNSAECDT